MSPLGPQPTPEGENDQVKWREEIRGLTRSLHLLHLECKCNDRELHLHETPSHRRKRHTRRVMFKAGYNVLCVGNDVVGEENEWHAGQNEWTKYLSA